MTTYEIVTLSMLGALCLNALLAHWRLRWLWMRRGETKLLPIVTYEFDEKREEVQPGIVRTTYTPKNDQSA